MAKHSDPRGRRKIIQLKDHLPPQNQAPAEEPLEENLSQEPQEERPQASFEYEDETASGKQKAWQAPKAFYRAAVVLLVAVLGLALWVNRANLTPENIWAWIQVQVMGDGAGDGYPVAITGSTVAQGNLTANEGNAVVLSDTALTILGPSGQEVVSLRHSLNQPILKADQGHYLLYNQGNAGYMVVSGTKTVADSSASGDILAGAVAHNGRFALATRGAEGASDLTVYLETGEEQFTYSFAQDYITCLALNADGTWGLVCTVCSRGGELISKVTVFDFNQTTPVAEYETQNNLLLGAYWGDNGSLYAVGDSSLLRGQSGEFAFEEVSYEGRVPTAFQFAGNQVYLSISAYEHAGPCTLQIYRGQEDPVEIQTQERVAALSVYGGSVAVLTGHELVAYDASTGQELARADAGSDAKSLALASESTAYVLGVSEIRKVSLS